MTNAGPATRFLTHYLSHFARFVTVARLVPWQDCAISGPTELRSTLDKERRRTVGPFSCRIPIAFSSEAKLPQKWSVQPNNNPENGRVKATTLPRCNSPLSLGGDFCCRAA